MHYFWRCTGQIWVPLDECLQQRLRSSPADTGVFKSAGSESLEFVCLVLTEHLPSSAADETDTTTDCCICRDVASRSSSGC